MISSQTGLSRTIDLIHGWAAAMFISFFLADRRWMSTFPQQPDAAAGYVIAHQEHGDAPVYFSAGAHACYAILAVLSVASIWFALALEYGVFLDHKKTNPGAKFKRYRRSMDRQRFKLIMKGASAGFAAAAALYFVLV